MPTEKNPAFKALIDLCLYLGLPTHGSPEEISKRIRVHVSDCRSPERNF